jgi:proline iminopeptidase
VRSRRAPRLGRALSMMAVALAMMSARAPAKPSAASGPGMTLNAGGVQLWYEVRNGGAKTKTPLVMLSGGPGFDHVYLLVSDAWDKLAAHRPLVFYDQRGTGRSGELKPGQSCTLADQVADLEALRARLGVERIDLLGHSWGGYLAMAYALRYPQHVAHIVLCDSAAPKWSDTDFMLKNVFPEANERREQDEFLEATGDAAASQASVKEYLSMLFVSPRKRDEFLATASLMHLSRAVNDALNADLARVDMGPMLPRLKMPVLVLTGRFDANVAPSTAWRIHKAIPGSRFEVFEQSGHLPFFEEPEAFARDVDRFLGQ